MAKHFRGTIGGKSRRKSPRLWQPDSYSPEMNHVLQGERRFVRTWISILVLLGAVAVSLAQEYGAADRQSPGDEMIQSYLREETEKLERDFPRDIKSAAEWTGLRASWKKEYWEMLGLWPLPERTALEAKVTRELPQGDYVVEMVHYQSRPGLYVTANLYRPSRIDPATRLPGILYVCGHSGRGRNGNKTAFQSQGIWFARHGYVCLVVDTLQLGEVAGIHHGTYREGRWWWVSRGYTPAGVECWNGVRGLDYLASRPEVDPDRLGVTGISGGGAATFWVAAADERVKAAAPVSGMADLVSYVPSRMINGHCDCMFFHNAHRWPWTRIAAMIAPRAQLFVNSDQDPIFPMDANERVINRLERIYSLFGAGGQVDSVVSIGGHDYRQDIRASVYQFMNAHLKGDARLVLDSEVDLVTGSASSEHPIPPEALRVFPTDGDIPPGAINGRVDETFVPMAAPAKPAVPGEPEEIESRRGDLLRDLRRLTFSHFPARVPPATLTARPPAGVSGQAGERWLVTEGPISIPLVSVREPASVQRVVLCVASGEAGPFLDEALRNELRPEDAVFVCVPRGIGPTRWTAKNPPNYVERSHLLLGRTVDSGRVWDLIAAARYLARQHPFTPVHVAGEGAGAALAVLAGLLEPEIAGVVLVRPPASLMAAGAPVFLNALRICDLAEAMGALAPKPLRLRDFPDASGVEVVRGWYRTADAIHRLEI